MRAIELIVLQNHQNRENSVVRETQLAASEYMLCRMLRGKGICKSDAIGWFCEP